MSITKTKSDTWERPMTSKIQTYTLCTGWNSLAIAIGFLFLWIGEEGRMSLGQDVSCVNSASTQIKADDILFALHSIHIEILCLVEKCKGPPSRSNMLSRFLVPAAISPKKLSPHGHKIRMAYCISSTVDPYQKECLPVRIYGVFSWTEIYTVQSEL